MENRPLHPVSSVDLALRVALLLQQEGPMRGSEVADRLGIARSTGHRLLTMLVYRGFAEQDEDRRYDAGLAMRSMEVAAANISELRATSMRHLQKLRDVTGETISLQVLSGLHVRFVASVESLHLLKVGDRDGRLFPAWDLSGGRALLAAIPSNKLADLLSREPDFSGQGLDALQKSLALVRRRGFAINDQRKRTEREVTAVARPLRGRDSSVVAAISVAMPTSRFSRHRLLVLNDQIATAVADIEAEVTSSAFRHDAE